MHHWRRTIDEMPPQDEYRMLFLPQPDLLRLKRHVAIGKWKDGGWYVEGAGWTWCEGAVSHWQPLPEAPSR